MSLSTGGVADMVFKQVVRGNTGNLSLDGQMLSVLVKLDGKRTLEQVAAELGMSLAAIRPIVIKLGKLKLIARVVKKSPAVDQEFLSFLISNLSVALGPLGEIVVDDGIEDLGFTRSNLPQKRCAELVNLLAQEIEREDKQIQFKQVMLRKIKEKGY